MKKGRKMWLRLVSAVMVCMICINFCYACSSAASIGWSLTRTNGPMSEWITNRTYGFDATQRTIKINCTSCGNGAVVHAVLRDQMTNSEVLHGHLVEGAELKNTKAYIGTNYVMKVSYEDYGRGYNHPTGKITY